MFNKELRNPGDFISSTCHRVWYRVVAPGNFVQGRERGKISDENVAFLKQQERWLLKLYLEI